MTTNEEKPVYTISTTANLLGITVHTIRMYEREGLIIPFKKESNQRLYSERDLERLRCIRHAITEEKMTIAGIKKILSLIPCWSIVKCTKKDRKNCQAYNGYNQPCWTLNHKNNYCELKDCRECEVYQSFGDCASIKDKLKELLP